MRLWICNFFYYTQRQKVCTEFLYLSESESVEPNPKWIKPIRYDCPSRFFIRNIPQKCFLCCIHAHWAEKLSVFTILFFQLIFFLIFKSKIWSVFFLHLHEILEGLYFHCSLSVCVCVRLFSCEQNPSRTDAPIWTQFSLNGCLPHWLKHYWNWWPLV